MVRLAPKPTRRVAPCKHARWGAKRILAPKLPAGRHTLSRSRFALECKSSPNSSNPTFQLNSGGASWTKASIVSTWSFGMSEVRERKISPQCGHTLRAASWGSKIGSSSAFEMTEMVRSSFLAAKCCWIDTHLERTMSFSAWLTLKAKQLLRARKLTHSTKCGSKHLVTGFKASQHWLAVAVKPFLYARKAVQATNNLAPRVVGILVRIACQTLAHARKASSLNWSSAIKGSPSYNMLRCSWWTTSRWPNYVTFNAIHTPLGPLVTDPFPTIIFSSGLSSSAPQEANE